MGFMIALAVLLVIATVVALVAQRRTARTTRTTRTARTRPPSGRSELDAEAEANLWLVRLSGSLTPPDAKTWTGADTAAAGRELTSAAECHRTARLQLSAARTATEYELATRTAREGLRHLDAARLALGAS